MRPSKVHPSTTKQPDSGLRLGFVDVDAKGKNQPSGVSQHTPSKEGISASAFDFRFARPGPQLGPEAQRMMDELREEALRIKAKLAAEREEENHHNEEERDGSQGSVGMRKFAQPKGKVGRFSDVHMAEFKRMDSIAGHPSSFRAQPGRFAPATTSLKRTQSKAKLDEREEVPEERKANNLTGRLENTAPAKRSRQTINDDTSSARQFSRDGETSKPLPSTPVHYAHSNLQSSITTPTQASLARSARVKQPATQIPTLSRSPSKPNLHNTPRTLPKSSTTGNLSVPPRSESKVVQPGPGKFDRVKSILRHPSFSLKKTSGIPSLTSPSKPNLEKALPSIPTTPNGSKGGKRVNFTPDTRPNDTMQNTPSPVKSGIPRSATKINFGIKSRSANRSDFQAVHYPSIENHSNIGGQSQKIEYPALNSPRPLPNVPQHPKQTVRPPPSVPGTFTFRSDHTINFGSSPKGFGSSPGQASLRQVRQSMLPSHMPGSFPDVNKENMTLPYIPHGMTNKKRRRVDSDDEEAVFEPSPKKHKSNVAMLIAPGIMAEKMAPESKIPNPTKKKVLSLSRLNMLARPKMRK